MSAPFTAADARAVRPLLPTVDQAAAALRRIDRDWQALPVRFVPLGPGGETAHRLPVLAAGSHRPTRCVDIASVRPGSKLDALTAAGLADTLTRYAKDHGYSGCAVRVAPVGELGWWAVSVISGTRMATDKLTPYIPVYCLRVPEHTGHPHGIPDTAGCPTCILWDD